MKKYRGIIWGIIIFLVLCWIIEYGEALFYTEGNNQPHYWVDKVELNKDVNITTNGVLTEGNVSLHFRLLSDKDNVAVRYNSLISKTEYGKDQVIMHVYFKCHNEKDNSLYTIDAYDKDSAFNVEKIPGGILGEYSAINEYNNYYTVKDKLVLDNIKDIDYCMFVGVGKR